MKNVPKTLMMSAALAAFLLPATAQNTNSPRIDQREQLLHQPRRQAE